MPAPPWEGTKVKVYLRMATQRLHTLIAKKENLAKTARRDIATLIERNKIEIARIRVEAMIHDDLHIELLETLELYTELLHTRFALLRNSLNSKEHTLDPSVKEAVISIVYGADSTEVTELKFVRESIVNLMGRDWVIGVMENRDNCVSPRVLGKFVTETPSPALVDAYLREIARGYRLSWVNTPEAQEVPEVAIPTAEGLTTLDGKVPDQGSRMLPKVQSSVTTLLTGKSDSVAPPDSGKNEYPVNPDSTTGAGDAKAPDIKDLSGPPTGDSAKYHTASSAQAPKEDKGKIQPFPRSILRPENSRLVRTPSPQTSKEPPPSYISVKPIPPGIEDDNDEDEDAELLRRFATLKGGRP